MALEPSKRPRPLADEDGLRPKRVKDKIEGVSASSLLGLKAQLFRRQQDVRGRAQAMGGGDTSERRRAGLDLSKLAKAANAGVEARDARDRALPDTEADKLQQSARRLEEKSRLYDDLASGRGTAPDDHVLGYGTEPSTSGAPHYKAPARAYQACPPPASVLAGTTVVPEAGRHAPWQHSHHGDSARPPQAAHPHAAPLQRDSPTYEPYVQRPSPTYEPYLEGPHGAHDGGVAYGQGGHGAMSHIQYEAAEEEEAAWRRRRWEQARALDDKIERLDAEEAANKARHAERRKLELEVAAEVSAHAQETVVQRAKKAGKQGDVKKQLLSQFVERQMQRKLKPAGNKLKANSGGAS